MRVLKPKMQTIVRPPFKQQGGKRFLARWIISNFPNEYTKYTYLEPYAGAASVLINKQPSEIEALNDLDKNVWIFRALRDEPKEFVRKLKRLKYSEKTFRTALLRTESPFDDYLAQAVVEYVLRRMSRDGLKKTFAWSDQGGQSTWETAVNLLPTIAKRMERVVITNKPALEIIKSFNDKNTLIYCDPPYLPDERTSKPVCEFEMTTDDHAKLAVLLNNFRGKVVLSGYPSPLYRQWYKGWKCEKKKTSQPRIKKIKTECIWKNF